MQAKQPDKQTKKHEKPLSLYPMSFDEAVERLVKSKPKKPKSSTPKTDRPKS